MLGLGILEVIKTLILSIELDRDEENRVVAVAKDRGLEPAEVIKKLVADYLPPVPEESETDPTLALFAKWRQEDEGMTADEVAEENRAWEEFKINLNAERDRAGARRVF